MLQKTEKFKELLDSKGWKVFTLCAFSLILPVCFYLSIFDEPLFNKTIIMIGFAVFCIYVFGWRKPTTPVSYVDRFVILMVVAACLTTLRASDLMADQGVAYTHIEELQRLLIAAFLGTYLYHKQKRAFEIGMRIVSWMIWISAVYQAYLYIPILTNKQAVYSLKSLEETMSSARYYCVSVYRNPIPCATIFVIGCALPLVRRYLWMDVLLKVIYIPGIIMTYARSGWIGMAVLVMGFLFEWTRMRDGKIGKWWIIIILLIPIITVFSIMYLTVIVGRRAGDSSVGRLKYWSYALTVMYPARPLISKIFGNGFYTSTVMHLTPVVMDNQPAIDNAFITILYEQGLFGLLAVFGMLLRAVRSIWNSNETKHYALALISACATAFFYELHFWAQAGFLAAVLMGVFWGKRMRCTQT